MFGQSGVSLNNSEGVLPGPLDKFGIGQSTQQLEGRFLTRLGSAENIAFAPLFQVSRRWWPLPLPVAPG